MKFVCPKCLKIADIEPVSPEHEIVSAYCLHRPSQLLACSETVQMEAVAELRPGAVPSLAGVAAGSST